MKPYGPIHNSHNFISCWDWLISQPRHLPPFHEEWNFMILSVLLVNSWAFDADRPAGQGCVLALHLQCWTFSLFSFVSVKHIYQPSNTPVRSICMFASYCRYWPMPQNKQNTSKDKTTTSYSSSWSAQLCRQLKSSTCTAQKGMKRIGQRSKHYKKREPFSIQRNISH